LGLTSEFVSARWLDRDQIFRSSPDLGELKYLLSRCLEYSNKDILKKKERLAGF
jgi:hypothetical protein